MNTDTLTISQSHIRKLLSAADPDAALLYLYLHSGNPLEHAAEDLKFTQLRFTQSSALLRQLGLWDTARSVHIVPGERPQYTEQDVTDALGRDQAFYSLYTEIQSLLGRALSTEDIKILLGFKNYLGFSEEVIHMLVYYCRDRMRQKGSNRNPSLRAIEKEAYAWADRGIDSVEEATAYIQTRNIRNSRIERLKEILQIRGRNLTAAEERHADAWLEMGFSEDALAMAYEQTCLNTGGMSWAYMNKILQRWHEAGLHSGEAVKAGARKQPPKGASGQLGAAELEAIQRLLREG